MRNYKPRNGGRYVGHQQRRALELMEDGGEYDARTVAFGLEVEHSCACHILRRLKELGYVEDKGRKPGPRGRPRVVYAVTSKGADLAAAPVVA